MSEFVKVVTEEGPVAFINRNCICVVRPRDKKTFAASGAVIVISEGGKQTSLTISPGANTNSLLKELGIDP